MAVFTGLGERVADARGGDGQVSRVGVRVDDEKEGTAR